LPVARCEWRIERSTPNRQILRVNSSPLVKLPEILQEAVDLLQAGRCRDAATALRRLLDLAPADPGVGRAVARLSTLARTWLAQGQIHLPLDVLAPLGGSPHADGTLLMLDGYALVSAGRKNDAEALWRRWLAKDPGNHDAARRLAAVLADNGKPTEADGRGHARP
jgi:thioredoxin-like negative regulator of GroEL